MCETGTLEELNVKPRDVVEYIPSGAHHTVYPEKRLSTTSGEVVDYAYAWDAVRNFRIISRASDTPKTWGEMTDAEKGALLLAYHEGKVIECSGGCDIWEVTKPSWIADIAYRIKPEPKRETVTYRGSIPNTPNVWAFHRTEFGTDTHRVIFDLIDGEPITGVFTNENGDVIKMEELK